MFLKTTLKILRVIEAGHRGNAGQGIIGLGQQFLDPLQLHADDFRFRGAAQELDETAFQDAPR